MGLGLQLVIFSKFLIMKNKKSVIAYLIIASITIFLIFIIPGRVALIGSIGFLVLMAVLSLTISRDRKQGLKKS